MNRFRRLFYKDVEGKVNDLLEYVANLEKERNAALEQVRLWNEGEEIKKAGERERAAYERLSQGFAPDKEQWIRIKAWEEKHRRKYHKPVNLGYPTKKIPNAPNYEYSFGYTHIGTMGSVECTVCYRKAIEKSKGNLAKLEEICEEEDIRFFIGEV